MNADSVLFSYIGNNIGYAYDCLSKVSQSAIQKNTQRPLNERMSDKNWILSTVMGTFQVVSAMGMANLALEACGVKNSLIVRAAIATLAVPMFLRPVLGFKEPTNFFTRHIIPLGDHIGTITHTIMCVSLTTFAVLTRDVFPLAIAISLAYGLADRAKIINPTVSKIVDWTRFGLLEFQLERMAVGTRSLVYPIAAIALLVLKIKGDLD
jgi:hypothetical protein